VREVVGEAQVALDQDLAVARIALAEIALLESPRVSGGVSTAIDGK